MKSVKTIKISDDAKDPAAGIALHTIGLGKQALIFVNTKRSAEAQAEKIAEKVLEKTSECEVIAQEALKAVGSPTRQCERLAKILRKGIAFHHSGLHAKQRELIEKEFRKGTVKVICCTPTLALGLNLPSFRTVVKDLHRFGNRGMVPIPVLEYMQYIGRSGRPDFNDTYGEAVTIANSEEEKERIVEHYIQGEPEEITSKLAVEPVLRMYVLMLVASRFCTSRGSLLKFFEKTFYGHQYGSLSQLKIVLDKVVFLLEEWEFIKSHHESSSAFRSANESEKDNLEATTVGKRVSELYVDPYTAHFLIEHLRKATSKKTELFGYLHVLANCLELRPLLSVSTKEYETMQEKVLEKSESLLVEEPSEFDEEYEEFLRSFKTALFFESWINEVQEEELLEQYAIRPGEIHAKLNRADWLVYASEELCSLLRFPEVRKDLAKLRLQLQYGVKEELLPLLRLKQIGRIRARLLYKNGIKGIEDVKKADYAALTRLLGKNIALDIKKQVGQDLSDAKVEVKENKRKGQISLKDY